MSVVTFRCWQRTLDVKIETVVRLSTAETSNAERQLAVCRLPVSFADLSV